MPRMEKTLKAYSTIAPGEVGESLYEDRTSQFFGFAVHAESAEAAIEFRHGIIARIPAASHYVSAWVLADGTEFFSDAKEPHGSAGLPTLNAIKGRDLKDTACVVARVFGGTLLGKGGLMRAYTKAATDALDSARTAQRIPCRHVEVAVPYQLYEPLANRLPSWNARVDDTLFTEQVTLHLTIPADEADELAARIRDFTNARAACSLGLEELCFLELPR